MQTSVDENSVAESRAWVGICSQQPAAVKLSQYGYVGGFYGACTEAAMMKELHDHGPIVVAFQVP